jgi:hypothetical protein
MGGGLEMVRRGLLKERTVQGQKLKKTYWIDRIKWKTQLL